MRRSSHRGICTGLSSLEMWVRREIGGKLFAGGWSGRVLMRAVESAMVAMMDRCGIGADEGGIGLVPGCIVDMGGSPLVIGEAWSPLV
jgi:hypothetical protein